jgi:hypothetical protein
MVAHRRIVFGPGNFYIDISRRRERYIPGCQNSLDLSKGKGIRFRDRG